jgi:hypothetical protein
MEWKKIATQADADALMMLFGDFHDSCIRDAHIWTGSYIDTSLSMFCSPGLDNNIRFLIQRQCENPHAIELLFEQVTRLNLVPAPENYDSIVRDAKLLLKGGEIYWSTDGDWSPERPDRDDFTWISAKKIRWREVNWLGKGYRYGLAET